MNPDQPDPMFKHTSDALLRYNRNKAITRMNRAKGPTAAQAAQRSAARANAEMERRGLQ